MAPCPPLRRHCAIGHCEKGYILYHCYMQYYIGQTKTSLWIHLNQHEIERRLFQSEKLAIEEYSINEGHPSHR